RVASNCCTRPGPSSRRMTARSSVEAPRASQGAASSIATPAASAANVPAKVDTWNVPSGVITGTGLSVTPGGWLRNRPHHNGYEMATTPATQQNGPYPSRIPSGTLIRLYAAARQPGPSARLPRRRHGVAGGAIRSPNSQAAKNRWTAPSHRPTSGAARTTAARTSRSTTSTAGMAAGAGPPPRTDPPTANESAMNAGGMTKTASPNTSPSAQNSSSRAARPVNGARRTRAVMRSIVADSHVATGQRDPADGERDRRVPDHHRGRRPGRDHPGHRRGHRYRVQQHEYRQEPAHRDAGLAEQPGHDHRHEQPGEQGPDRAAAVADERAQPDADQADNPEVHP